MRIRFGGRGTTLVVHLEGELDQHGAEYARNKIDAQIKRSLTRNVIFDFSGVEFMDSSGIGVVMGRYRYLSRLGGGAAIVNKNPHIARILDLSGLREVIPVYGSVDAAVSSFVKKDK